MIKKNKVSILIVAYNAWDYIINTIKSVLAQSYTNFEILILDNNSSDNTIENIESFRDHRIQLFQWAKNIWPYAGLNYLLKKSSWEYIAIQDHDDIWHSHKLKIQISFLEKNTKYKGCWTNTVMYYEYDKKYFLYSLKRNNYYTIHPSLVFRYDPYFKYDQTLTYFWDAYSQKFHLCKWDKKIYTIETPLTLHIIKDNYQNYSYSWFKISHSCIQRIFDVHNVSFYSFLIIFYEIFRKWFIKILWSTKNKKMFMFFDRFPYVISWNTFHEIHTAQDIHVKEMSEQLTI